MACAPSIQLAQSNTQINCYITYTFLLLCLFQVYGIQDNLQRVNSSLHYPNVLFKTKC